VSTSLAFALQVLALVVALTAVHRPLGDFMAATLESPRHLRVERLVYRGIGVDPDADTRWPVYLRAVLAFSIVSIIVVYGFVRLQALLPYNLGFDGMPSLQSLNTAVSFVTNTNWQSYSGEAALGYTANMAALAVQNFLSAAVGIVVAITLVRGFARTHTDRVGNFWVDLTRITLRVLLPLAVIFGIVLILNGVVQNFNGDTDVADAGRALRRPSLGVLWPARRPSRRSARTAAASTTRTRRTRSRTPTGSRTCSRSSCC
jgi:K+-transporting ATPase ATPase A chain